MRKVILVILLLLALIFGTYALLQSKSGTINSNSPLAAQTTDVTSILAQYKANAARFATLRVTWSKTHEHLPAWFASNEKQAIALEGGAAENSVKAADKAALLQQARQFRDMNKYNREPSVDKYDFWTDGRGFQVRIPRPEAAKDTNVKFPDDPLTPESLAGAYAGIRIFSWAPAQVGSLRVWQGKDPRDGAGQAMISDKTVKEAIVNFQFPPLGARNAAWGDERQNNPIDLFFSGEPSQYQIVRTETLNQKKVIVVDRVRIGSPHEDLTKQPGKAEVMHCMRAWIDPEQGGMPLRVEGSSRWRFNGKPLGDPEKSKPYLVTEIQDVASVSGAFYPRKFQSTAYFADPSITQNPNDIDGMIAGTAKDVVTVPYQRTSVELLSIEAGRAMPPEMFAPRFPDNAAVADETRPKPGEKAQALKLGDLAPEWQVAAWTDGRSRKLSDYRGKIVLLDFWGTWCGPCVQLLPAIELVQKKHGDGLVCLEIHTAGAEMSKVRELLERKGISAPSAIDTGEGREGTTGALYGVDAWPHLVLIDRGGKIAWTSRVKDNEEQLAQAAKAANLSWPPQNLTEDDIHRLHVALLSMQVDKIK